MVRTRFAPSPTGHLHIGGLRTALYAYLFAKKNNGHFLLRIEDTDRNRLVEGATEHLIEMLEVFGVECDEGPHKGGDYGPYIQSERVEMHKKAADELIEKGAAYKCFCSAERLDEMREAQAAAKQAPMYDQHCRHLSEEEVAAQEAEGKPYVVRLKVPYDSPIEFQDLVRGRMKFDPKTIDDQILLKSDGFPTYHLANVVDDHDMKITHVIRGEEWLPSTPKHVVLYQAFGWEVPEFAHLPLILNMDRTKLSKRQNDVNVEDYLAKGYTKEAILNFIVFLGWHPGGGEEEEIFSLSELIEKFSLEKVHKGGAVFDIEKFKWFNWQWRRRVYLEKVKLFAQELQPDVAIQEVKKGRFVYVFKDPEHMKQLLAKKAVLLKEVCDAHLNQDFVKSIGLLGEALLTVEDKILKEPENVNEFIDFFFELPEYSAEMFLHEKMKVDQEMAKKALVGAVSVVSEMDESEVAQEAMVKEQIVGLIAELGVKNGQVLWPLRVGLSGKEFSPGAFEIISTLGKEESLNRLEKAIAKL